MQSKLDKLVADPKFGSAAKDYEAGILVYGEQETLNYINLIYDDHHEVYLSLFDESRDYLVVGIADDLEGAKELAVEELDKKINRSIH